MKIFALLILLCATCLGWAMQDERFIDNKVLYENPREEDVLKVNTALGFCTVLSLKEKPIMVTVGNNSMLQVEIPQNSTNVVIKPLQEAGETNLFIFTASQRFNYKVVIGDETQLDYVVDTKESMPQKDKPAAKRTLESVLKEAKAYATLKNIGAINQRQLKHQDLFYSNTSQNLKVDFVEGFGHKNPNYLILHIIVHNTSSRSLTLVEKDTHLFVHKHKFTPQYILFNSSVLGPGKQTDGWLVLEDTYVSVENRFKCVIATQG